MSKLYELAEDFETLYAALDELDPADENYEDMSDAWFDTLEGIEGEFTAKAENIAVFIKRLNADADAMRTEEKALAERRHAAERKADSIKKYLKDCMDKLGMAKVDGVKAKVSIRNNAESVLVTDPDLILFAGSPWLKPQKYTEDDLAKTNIKKAIQDGTEVPGCTLVRTRSLIIK